MWKKIVVFVLAAVSLYAAVSVQAAETKREAMNKKAKAEKKAKKEKNPTEIVWQKDMKSALAAAKKGKKNILLIHIAPQVNNNSKLFNKHIIQNKNLVKESANIVFIKFEYKDMKNRSKEAIAADKLYPIEKIGNRVIMPTVYLLDSAGKIIDKKVGFSEKNPASYLKSFKVPKKSKKK